MGIALVNSEHSSERLYDVVARILGASMSCSMATTCEDGKAHINAAFFAFDEDLNLYFLSHPKSAHVRNLEARQTMAVAVYDDRQPWGAAHAGLQLFGRAEEAKDAVEQAARDRYVSRFPLYRDFTEGGLSEGSPKRSFFELRFYVFRPASVKILDEAEFGDEVLLRAEFAPAGA